MESTQVNLFYGSLLHDIGKIVQRSTQQKIKHSQLGTDFIKKYQPNKNIMSQISYHHYQELSQARLEPDDLAYITYIADNIASGVDRRKNNKETQHQWNSKANLEDIFNKFLNPASTRYFRPRQLDLAIDHVFPKEEQKEFTPSDYSGIIQRIEDTLSVTSFTEEYVQSILNLLEATASFIPSSTNMEEVVDISLFDHMKLTAGFAAAIHAYLVDQKRTRFREELFVNSQSFYKEEAFLLVSFDLSGIQNFIYTITSSGAHKQLRSRSFYLDMIGEWLVDRLLKKASLTRANLVYSGGGHAYIILPNTKDMIDKIKETEKEFNEFFLDKFGTSLYVAFGHQAFSAREVMSGSSPEEYRRIFQKVSQKISSKKLKRYSSEDLLALNGIGKPTGRECSVCHRMGQNFEDSNRCLLCYKLENFSKGIQTTDFFEVNKNETGLPIGPNAYLHTTTEKDIKNGLTSGMIYSKNQFHTGINQATRLWVADYSQVEHNLYSRYVEREWTELDNSPTKGIKRLGVLRCDVDDLGYAFIAGFSEQESGRYNTFTRSAVFSRSMSLFFKLYINEFAESKKLTIIYSGGDDVFLLGAWDSVLAFAVELRQRFIRYTNGKLTLSTGIGLFPDKTPINIMARETGVLETAAKDNGKDSISVFSEKYTFKYDTFINDIYSDKLVAIRNFFENESERGKAFIYKILDLIRERDEEDRIAFARLAYYLSRLEAISTDKKKFGEFKRTMKNWFDDSEQIKQVEIALILYLYETRKDG